MAYIDSHKHGGENYKDAFILAFFSTLVLSLLRQFMVL